MTRDELLQRIAHGRTDLVIELLHLDDWRDALAEGAINALRWCVYYDDTTAIRAVLDAGGDLSPIDKDEELLNAAFFGHWKVCDLLLEHGADVNARVPETGETALHNAFTKANRPHYFYVVRLLIEHGADPNARTIPGRETGGFMRDVRTMGETPLHRAAAFADAEIIEYLLDHGADREARDDRGDSPMAWASLHLRPGSVLELLGFAEHRVGPNAGKRLTSDHGAGWGNGMERNLMGDYLPLSLNDE